MSDQETPKRPYVQRSVRSIHDEAKAAQQAKQTLETVEPSFERIESGLETHNQATEAGMAKSTKQWLWGILLAVAGLILTLVLYYYPHTAP